MRKHLLVLLTICLVGLSFTASATRHGNISWQQVGSNPNTIQFKISSAWRTGFFAGVNGNPAIIRVGSIVNTGQYFRFGDGSSASFRVSVLLLMMLKSGSMVKPY